MPELYLVHFFVKLSGVGHLLGAFHERGPFRRHVERTFHAQVHHLGDRAHRIVGHERVAQHGVDVDRLYAAHVAGRAGHRGVRAGRRRFACEIQKKKITKKYYAKIIAVETAETAKTVVAKTGR